MTEVVVAPSPAVAALTTSLAFLGPWGSLLSAAMLFGVPFVTKIIANAQKGTDPTSAEWDETVALVSTPGEVLIPQRPA